MSKSGPRVRFDFSVIVSHYQMNAIVLPDILHSTCTDNIQIPECTFGASIEDRPEPLSLQDVVAQAYARTEIL